MAEWVGDERAQTLTIGHVRADVWMYGGCTVRSTVEPRGCKNLDAAKAAAEQALREMHGALAAHFAPVLRWSDYMGSVDGLEHWALEIGQQPDDRWWWITSLGDAAADDGGNCASADDARRAAEAALRSLGVTFRTEGEG